MGRVEALVEVASAGGQSGGPEGGLDKREAEAGEAREPWQQ